MATWARSGSCFLLLGFLVAGVGCGSSRVQRAAVKGKVTIGGKALNAGTVSFTTKDNKSVGAAIIDANGNYAMADAPVGEVVITVTVPKGGTMGGMGRDLSKDKTQPPKDVGPMRPPDGSGDPGTTAPKIDPSKIVKIPEKYSSTETSGLKYTVEKGEHEYDITLTP
jgi:hypothetical protein